MRTMTIWLGTLGLTAGLCTMPQDGPAEFELEVGEKTYDVALDKPLEIVTPGGERVRVVLRRKKVIQYSAHGISFKYPSDMKLEVDQGDVISLTLSQPGTSLLVVIQLYPAKDNQPEGVRAGWIGALKEDFQKLGAENIKEEKDRTRKIAGEERKGERLVAKVGDQTMVAEAFSFKKGEKIVLIVLQHDEMDAGKADPAFSRILDTFE